jgi:transposase InsO family protein
MARNLTDPFDGFLRHHTHIIMDGDPLLRPFAGVLASNNMDIINTPPKSPNCNSFIERFFRSLKGECLDHRIFFSEADLRQTIVQYLEHFHTERVHQGIGHRIIRPGEEAGRKDGRIAVRERCGGILKYVYREAA